MKFSCQYSILLAFIFICYNGLAQQGRRGSGGNKPALSIQGRVVDNDTGQGLEFATISIYTQQDSSIVTGGITDIDGKFLIESRPGSLYALVEFISYTTKTIPNIILNPRAGNLDLGEISLVADAEMLDEVEVVAEKSSTQFSLDKKVFNVGKDLSRSGGTAIDVLENVPSVSVDIEGGVSLRGSENVRILVDGKPSGLVGLGDAGGLRSFPANMIERIEVITNPSARYEAEGMGGIINIVLKKTEKQGFNGSIDVTAGLPLTTGLAFNLNYRKEKFNWFLNYGLRYNRNPGFGMTENRLTDGDTIQFSNQRRDHIRGGLNNSIRFGADYYFTDNDILTTALNYRRGDEANEVRLKYEDRTILNSTGEILDTELTRRFDDEIEKENKLEYSLTYKKKYKKDHEWVTDFRYQDNREVESSDLSEAYFDLNEVPLGKLDLLQRSANAEGERVTIIQSDYTWPITKDSRLEVGARASLRIIENDYLVEEFEADKEVWNALAGLSNNFIYDEKIYAAYLIYGNKIGQFSYQIGLRGEYTDVMTELKQTNELNPRSYPGLFPSAHINYAFTEKVQAQLSYSRRISRPRFWDLNPFFTFSDARNFFSGNPDLDPEYTNAYEASLISYMENGSISSSLYYRRSTDVIRRTIVIDSTDSVIRTIRRPENLDTRDDIGIEISGNYRIKKLNFNANLNFFRAITNDERIGDADTYSWFGKLTANMKLTESMDAQLSFNYRGAEDYPQGSRSPIAFMDLGWSKDLLKNKATLTISVRDLANSRKRRSITILDDFYGESEFQWRSRIVQATFNYRINQKKKRGGGNRGGSGGGGDF